MEAVFRGRGANFFHFPVSCGKISQLTKEKTAGLSDRGEEHEAAVECIDDRKGMKERRDYREDEENLGIDFLDVEDGESGQEDFGEDSDSYLRQIERNERNRRRREQQKQRKLQRLQEVRRARLLLVLILAACAAAVAGIVILIRNGLVPKITELTNQEASAEASTEHPAQSIGASAIGTPDYESTGTSTEEAEEGSTLPSETQIEIDRTAKNYSADVATFWPYYYFYEDENTQLIPCEEALAAQDSTTGGSSGTTEASESDTEASSAEDTEADAASSGTSESSTESSTELTEASTESLTETSEEDSTQSSETGYTDPYAIGDEGDTFTSQYGILVNVDTGEIVAKKNPYDRIVPASMTKVMTLLVAVEQMTDPETQMKEMVTLTQADEEYAYVNGSSAVCWMPGDTATVEDLMYGTILPSGADAAVALAEYTAGSQEAFVELMNQKAEELGLADTHFVNCVGVYDENHYSTASDIAVIMKAAVENDICRKVLSTHTWTTSPTSEHPEGITVSNWFLRRIEDSDNHGTVLCAKTGYVEESGFCAVSYQIADDGTHYILCSADTWSQWRAIKDHTAIYQEYTK